MRLALWTTVFLVGCGGSHPSNHPITDAGIDMAQQPAMGPMVLSQTGLYGDFSSRTLAPGIIQYTPRYELWSDGAEKSRMLLLPKGTQIDTSDMDNWVFPVGTKVWKEFRQDGRLVETRLLHKLRDGAAGWWQMAYAWNSDGTEATAAPDGVPSALGTSHDVPSQDQCTRCHENVRDVLIGVSAIQLSAADGHGPLSRLAAAALLSAPPSGEFEVPGQGTVKAALGYLHGNCGHCHNDGSTIASHVVLRMRLRVTDRTPETTPTYATSINVKMYHVFNGTMFGVAPGAPDKSQLYVRMGLRDESAMPPVCTKLVDMTGLGTVRDWITGLPH